MALNHMAHKFRIILGSHGGWTLYDTDSFNNWGRLSQSFSTLEEAKDYARRCDEFKRGRRSRIDLMPWEYAEPTPATGG